MHEAVRLIKKSANGHEDFGASLPGGFERLQSSDIDSKVSIVQKAIAFIFFIEENVSKRYVAMKNAALFECGLMPYSR